MSYLLYFFAALFAVCGLTGLIAPIKIKQLRSSLVEVVPTWGVGVISLIVAFFLWYASVSTLAPGFMRFLAVLAGLKGLAFLFLPKPKIERLMQRWLNLPDIYFRLIGIILIFFAFYLYRIIIY